MYVFYFTNTNNSPTIPQSINIQKQTNRKTHTQINNITNKHDELKINARVRIYHRVHYQKYITKVFYINMMLQIINMMQESQHVVFYISTLPKYITDLSHPQTNTKKQKQYKPYHYITTNCMFDTTFHIHTQK